MEPPRLGLEQGIVRRLSLVRLSSEIARSVSAIGTVAVEGEVVRPTSHPGGTYFTLRDRTAQVSVRCPAARLTRCRVVTGERVLVTATVAWLPERGQLQLVAAEVAPVGEGAIAAAIQERRGRLAAEGLLDRPRRPLPRLPTTIGVVCGADAAVRADIDSVVEARFPGYPVTYLITNVSGPGAADAVTDALLDLDARPDVEVIVVARGGGDAAQLLPFSDEELCRAMCRLDTPVVSAIGHDGDRPLCDEVADRRCGTPSLAATLVVPSREELQAELDHFQQRALDLARQRLDRAIERLGAVDPDQALQTGLHVAAGRIGQATKRLHLIRPHSWAVTASAHLHRLDWRSPLWERLERQEEQLTGTRRHMEALSPTRVLERGYAVVRTADGAVMRQSDETRTGDLLDVQLARGRLGVRVEQVKQ
jgi:exodeoxyribonuclease VII large subunit